MAKDMAKTSTTRGTSCREGHTGNDVPRDDLDKYFPIQRHIHSEAVFDRISLLRSELDLCHRPGSRLRFEVPGI